MFARYQAWRTAQFALQPGPIGRVYPHMTVYNIRDVMWSGEVMRWHMGIPGVDTILETPAKKVWPGEHEPTKEFARLFDEIPHLLELGWYGEVTERLDQITASDTLEPSQTMRLHYLQGWLLSDMQDYRQAFQFYRQACEIAEDHGDLDSQITLVDHCGLMLYGQMRHRDATLYYQEALGLWRTRAAQLLKPRAEPEVKFYERIGATQWNTGDFDEARVTLARGLTIALYKPGIPRTDFIRDRAARALWTLGMTLRSQSDMRDGDISLLRLARKRLKQASELFALVGQEQENVGRLHIQIAELELDLAEIYLHRGADAAARGHRDAARQHMRFAAELTTDADRPAAKLLPELTMLRYDITRNLNRSAVRNTLGFASRLQDIEQRAEAIDDAVISGKAATLRGEWCLWLGDSDQARAALLLAITDFGSNNMGMATRAQRLLRHSNEPIRPPDGPNRQRRSGGPIPSDSGQA